ncbi:PQ loop repeat-domain-containing protein [Aspergillus transmontanensis]|uniref:PQ loop repeat-domain-containing protein n=1 Tax=Aspergillus transmontanensis TaxID=1034304 RepID=A0A5N6W7C3_9EURO|nr:PQ loop repeat-domain-containing protein [Aspergillus transmontanensis]
MLLNSELRVYAEAEHVDNFPPSHSRLSCFLLFESSSRTNSIHIQPSMSSDTWTQSISQILGWAYFILWSLSFYPQVLHNHRRHSTDGFSIDFALLNLLGLTSYTVFNACFLFSPVVRTQYAQRHLQSPEPTVQWNDFVYALHGALICCYLGSHFLCARFWNFESKPQRVSNLTLVVVLGCMGVVSPAILWVLVSVSWEWIDVVRGLPPGPIEITT